MQIRLPGIATRFEEALAGRQGWALDFAERVADEYRGFLYLAATAGFEVTPSQAVDEAWHLHLALPHYEEVLCRRILGRRLDHRPGTGEPDDEQRCGRQYVQTLELYEQVFHRPPPSDIWPRPAFDEEERALRVAGRRKLAVAGVATLLAAAAAVQVPDVADLFLALIVAGIVLSLIIPFLGPGRRRRNTPCGGGCGTGSDGACCGASCGGGCGGD